MTPVDWVVLGFVFLAALVGLRRGLIVSALSAVGIVAGALVGARLAPELLPRGSSSPYTPVIGLAGAVGLAAVLQTVGSLLGANLRAGLRIPTLRTLDSLGGLALGAVTGLTIVWVLGAVALQLPGQTVLRHRAQESQVLRRLNDVVPPERGLQALSRVDPFPRLAGPAGPVAPPTRAILRERGVRIARPSVVRVLGTACGLGIAGSGWVAQPGLVVTAAHVVAGQDDTSVEPLGDGRRLPAEAVAFDARNDLAVLRVAGLRTRPLRFVDPRANDPVAILGYPENGAFDAAPGRIGQTATVLSENALGQGLVRRTVTHVRGRIRQGNSGGPAVNERGEVETTLFAARAGNRGGYGVPASVLREALAQAGRPVSTGDCVRG